MIIVSQFKNSITESIELDIIEKKTSKNEIIPKEVWDKFKKITQKKADDNSISLKELKGLGEMLGKEMTRTVYIIVEIKSKRNLGTYTTREKAKQAIHEMLQAIEKQKTYQMSEDKELGMTIF